MKIFRQKLLAAGCTACLLAASLAGCGTAGSGTSSSSSSASSAVEAAAPISVTYSAEDTDSSWDASSATSVSLQGTSITVDGNGASAKDGTLTITAAGTYVLSGTLSAGQVVINTGKEDTVRLVLNGASISSSTGSAIDAEQSKKVIITLAEGTSNTVSDAAAYSGANQSSDGPNAAIFSEDDLTVNGAGKLTVNGNCMNGIVSKDSLVITGGKISVTAVNDAIRGKDSVAIQNGTFTLNAGGDGIQSNNDNDTSKGWISLDGGVYDITASHDGVQAETVLQVSGGTYSLVTGGGSANASTGDKGNDRQGWGQRGPASDQSSTSGDTSSAAEDETESTSAKGLKAGTGVILTGGTYQIDSSDDSIHSNGSVSVSGGTFSLSSGDDGMHADSSLNISDGTITIAKSYEGIEGATIIVSGGKIDLTASDDGLNAAGGNDQSSTNGRPGQNSFSSDSSYLIQITGGSLYINASGDGIDSNGNLEIDGGTILVNGPTNDGNGALDYGDNATCIITGGILVAAGSSGMMETPGTSSTQNTLAVVYSSTQKAGTLVTVKDEDGASVLTFAPSKDYESIVISTPELKQGKTYMVYSGGTCSSQSTNGFYEQGTCSGSTKLTDVTLSSAVTKISDSGSAVTTGGMNGGGGMKRGQGGMGLGNGGQTSDQSQQS